ncbi:zinc finger MYM-type protein 1-like [Arctopsyche grandis]|uniref:zinc finger MYM-type protein 1-like n=1 Tax=Arctopsyche grandis TaxID=121162 RepID=UPI00406D7FA1
MLDETTDIASQSQLSTVFRYVKDGDIQERFLGFSDVSKNRTASGLSEHVFKLLEEFQCVDKLVAQGYDGAATFSGHLNGLQSLVKMKCPNAIFIHCYTHRLNLVLSQSVNFIKECKIFFKTLHSIPSFFAHSTKRMNALIESEVKKRFPSVSNTRWNYNSRIVNTVYENKLELVEFLNNIIDNPDNWDSNTFMTANGFVKVLECFDFSFQLEIFNDIFASTYTLFNILQSKSFDIKYRIDKVKEIISLLNEKRNDFILVYTTIKNDDNIESPRKRRRDDDTEKYLRLYNEIFDTTIRQMEVRFNDLKELSFIDLIDFKKISKFKASFPDEQFSSLKSKYQKFFNLSKLRSELMAVYSLSDFSGKTVTEIVKFLKETELADEAYSEIYKLSTLILTIPVSTLTVERTFSSLKRIKTSIRNAQGESRLSMLSMISIEKKLHEDIQNRRNFYDMVVQKFIEKGVLFL